MIFYQFRTGMFPGEGRGPDRPLDGPRPSPGNSTVTYPSALQKRAESGSELRWAWRHANSSFLHRGDLVLSAALAAGDDRSGMAHAAARRRGPAGDEADGGLGPARFCLIPEELRRILLGRAADLADHDDRFRLGIGEEEL